MEYDIDSVKEVLNICADKAIYSKPLLTELDSRMGDGDLGMSMSKGAMSIKNEIISYKGTDIGEFFRKCAATLNRAAPSTMGTLLSGAMMMLGKKLKGRIFLEDKDILAIPVIMADSIMMRGNAKLGDKTILDSLIPLAEAMNASYALTGDLKTAVREAATAAKKGAKSTKGLIAKVGRAKWIADRSREYPDSGAVLCSILIDALAYTEKHEGYKLPNYE